MKIKKARKHITSFPIRTCQSLHECCICCRSITLGQRYYDGGYNRRAHEKCVGEIYCPECGASGHPASQCTNMG